MTAEIDSLRPLPAPRPRLRSRRGTLWRDALVLGAIWAASALLWQMLWIDAAVDQLLPHAESGVLDEMLMALLFAATFAWMCWRAAIRYARAADAASIQMSVDAETPAR